MDISRPLGARAAVTLYLLILKVDDPNLRDAVAGIKRELDVPVFFSSLSPTGLFPDDLEIVHQYATLRSFPEITGNSIGWKSLRKAHRGLVLLPAIARFFLRRKKGH